MQTESNGKLRHYLPTNLTGDGQNELKLASHKQNNERKNGQEIHQTI